MDFVMYHPSYEGPKEPALTYEQNLGPIDEESIFRPPEDEECIAVYSDKRTPKKGEKKSKAKNERVDPNPFDLKQTRSYHANAEYSHTNKIYTS